MPPTRAPSRRGTHAPRKCSARHAAVLECLLELAGGFLVEASRWPAGHRSRREARPETGLATSSAKRAYATLGSDVSSSTPAPCRSAVSFADRRTPRPFRRAPTPRTTHGPSPAPTKTCSVHGGQWTKSHARKRRSSPSTISRHSPARTRKSSCASSPWYMRSARPGWRTPMPTPSCRSARLPSRDV